MASSKDIGMVLTTHAIAPWRSPRHATQSVLRGRRKQIMQACTRSPAMLLICGRCCVCSRAEQSAGGCAHKHLLLLRKPALGRLRVQPPSPMMPAPLRQDQRQSCRESAETKSANLPSARAASRKWGGVLPQRDSVAFGRALHMPALPLPAVRACRPKFRDCVKSDRLI